MSAEFRRESFIDNPRPGFHLQYQLIFFFFWRKGGEEARNVYTKLDSSLNKCDPLGQLERDPWSQPWCERHVRT